MEYPGVAEAAGTPDPAAPLLPIVPVRFEHRGVPHHYFSTVTTLGTPQDVTAQELRIECFFPI
jgi:hypothetical protein